MSNRASILLALAVLASAIGTGECQSDRDWVENRNRLTNESAAIRVAPRVWLTTELDKSPQADLLAEFLLNSYDVLGTNISDVLAQTTNRHSPALKRYAEKLYRQDRLLNSTNGAGFYGNYAHIWFQFDPTNAARSMVRDILIVPFKEYNAEKIWTYWDYAHGYRGIMAVYIVQSEDEEAVSALGKLLNHPETDFRRVAAYALGSSTDARYVDRMLQRLGTETEPLVRKDLRYGIRYCAYHVLYKRAQVIFPRVRIIDASDATQKAMFRREAEVKAQVSEWLDNGDPPTRILAAYAVATPSVDWGQAPGSELRRLTLRHESETDDSVKRALEQAIQLASEDALEYYKILEAKDYGPPREWMDIVKQIESHPLLGANFHERARATRLRWEAEQQTLWWPPHP